MDSKKVLEYALALGPNEKFLVVEGILRSLDEPDASLDAIWGEEAERRLAAYREGSLKGIPMEEVFREREGPRPDHRRRTPAQKAGLLDR